MVANISSIIHDKNVQKLNKIFLGRRAKESWTRSPRRILCSQWSKTWQATSCPLPPHRHLRFYQNANSLYNWSGLMIKIIKLHLACENGPKTLFHRVLLVEVREIIWYIFVVSALVPLWRDVARADTFHFLAILLPHSPFSTCTTFFFKAPKSSSSNISQTVSFSLHLNPLLHSDKERSTPRPMKNRPLWPLENVFRLIFILNFLRLLLRVEEVPLLLSFHSLPRWVSRATS